MSTRVVPGCCAVVAECVILATLARPSFDALVDDYLAKAKRIGYAPMHGWF
jgi:hypothetical protein